MKNPTKKISVFISVVVALVLLATPLSSMELSFHAQAATTIIVPGTTTTIDLWEETLETGETATFYTIYQGGVAKRTTQTSYELGLRYEHFDPLISTPSIPSVLKADNDVHLYIVQFYTQPLVEYQEAITAIGGTIHNYIAQNAHLVELTDNQLQQVVNLPYVRWVGQYHPAYRLEQYMVENLQNAEQAYPLLRYNIMVHEVEHKAQISERMIALDWNANPVMGGKLVIEATLTPNQLFEVITWDEVLFVDRWSPLEPDMDVAREIGGANYIETVDGFTGEGVRGESFDTGFNLAHVDFASRPLIVHGSSVPNDSHGTACVGICFGDGTGNPQARGLLPDGQGIVTYYASINWEGSERYTHTGELVEDPYYAVFQTASVGSARCLDYSTISAESDHAIFDFDIILCQSQSNAGDQMSRPQAWAKNIVSGGGIYHYDTLDRSDDMWNYGGSIGPAMDGRIKPTLTMFYDDILTTSSSGPTSYTYSFGGTSGATPIIAGHFGLFFQMWSEGIFGNEVNPSGTVFENKAHFTTAKAMMINSAYQYPFNGTTEDKTRMHQGWGMPNLQTLYDLREKIYVIDEEDVLNPLEVSTHYVAVNPGEPSLKVTMTYADPPGNPAVQTQHRINDITLQVIAPDETEYWGNYGLLTGVWSEPGGNADTKNTVENVFIKDPMPGVWTINIYADEIIEDSHVETTGIDADYALVVSGVQKYLPPPYGPDHGDCGCPHDFFYEIPEELGFPELYAMWDWDDGTYTDWMGPYSPGETLSAAHGWNHSGYSGIRVKLSDNNGYESVWSQSWMFEAMAPRLEISQAQSGIGKISTIIRNRGGGNATDVAYSIVLDGGIILLGKETTGVIEQIEPDGEVEIFSDFIFGFGETTYTISAMPLMGEGFDERVNNGFVILFYPYIKPGGG